MRVVLALTLTVTMITSITAAQTLDKELVATFSGPEINGAIVSELLWDGGTLIIQSAAMGADGHLSPQTLGRVDRAGAGKVPTIAQQPAADECRSPASVIITGVLLAQLGRRSERRTNQLLHVEQQIASSVISARGDECQRLSGSPQFDGRCDAQEGPEIRQILRTCDVIAREHLECHQMACSSDADRQVRQQLN